VAVYPGLTSSRLHREIRELGYGGGYTMVKDFLREVWLSAPAGFEVRFETPPGQQAQVDFAHFRTVFTDEPGVERVVWLFSLVLGHSRMLWGRFVPQQDLGRRCHRRHPRIPSTDARQPRRSACQTPPTYTAQAQPVVATAMWAIRRCSSNASAGVFQ